MFIRKPYSIRRLKGSEAGRRAFILANGPSILQEPLEQLDGALVIGMNAATLLQQQFGFAMPYYTVSDTRFLQHPEKRAWATTALAPATLRVLRRDLRPVDDPALLRRTAYAVALGRDGYSADLDRGFYYGATTTMLAIQLAHYLGARSICLLGVDLRYAPEAPRFYAESNPQPHDPFTSAQIWNIANAARILEAEGVELTGCSEHSLLRPYLPYSPLSRMLREAA